MILSLLSFINIASFAEKEKIPTDIHRTMDPNKSTQVDRAPMRIPIEVYYDFDTNEIEVIGPDTIEAEIFIYNASRELESYSSVLNVSLPVLSPGNHTIIIKNDGWYMEGFISI